MRFRSIAQTFNQAYYLKSFLTAQNKNQCAAFLPTIRNLHESSNRFKKEDSTLTKQFSNSLNLKKFKKLLSTDHTQDENQNSSRQQTDTANEFSSSATTSIYSFRSSVSDPVRIWLFVYFQLISNT
jgi:hypothetical protein